MPLARKARYAWDVGCELYARALGVLLTDSQIGKLHSQRNAMLLGRCVDEVNVEVLDSPEFVHSVKQAGPHTLLDTPRLANLWSLCRATDAEGAILEVGTFRGGSALHLATSSPDRKMVVCDPFSSESFESLDTELDANFSYGDFASASEAHVQNIFKDAGKDVEIIAGYFPGSVQYRDLPKISFAYIDVDVYKAMLESLNYLADSGVLLEKSLIVIDDFCRRAEGVDKAVEEFLAAHPGWRSFPLFPSQGLLVPPTY